MLIEDQRDQDHEMNRICVDVLGRWERNHDGSIIN